MRKLLYVYLSVLCSMVLVSKSSAQETAPQYLSAGVQFYQARDYANAEKSFQAALQLDPKNAGIYQYLGNVL
jgi:Tfp pilus assembly protein PilF